MTEPLDPLQLPLQGSRLIEASAGTGKTWTIAALYLRLVLGHGLARALLPGEVLVLTFTKAATRELSERIRGRLVQAAEVFRGEATAAADDSLLRALLDAHPAGPARQAAAWRLGTAALAMDDAAIHTIDAWCQRMLREHAFDSGSLFDEQLQPDESALLAEAARDYWRREVYPLSDAALVPALALWQDAEALVADVRGLVDKPLPADAGRGTLADLLETTVSRHAALKTGWAAHAAEMAAWLHGQLSLEDCAFSKNKLRPESTVKWMQALRHWAGSPAMMEPKLRDTAPTRLRSAGMRDALKKGRQVDLPPCFAAFDTLMDALAALPEWRPALRAHAAHHVGARLQQLKAQAGTYGYADLLRRLDDALDVRHHGDRAVQLRARIVQQYPVALVDEFQDTSPLQLSIFDRLYRIADDDPSTALMLIGDPKQSIYAFRGADIHGYLGVRAATQGRHHVLGTNRRSTVALVDAVNALFLRAEQRPGDGAFLFSTAAGTGGTSGLPFVPVAAHGREETLVAAGGPVEALTFEVDGQLRKASASFEHLGALCADRIVELLADPAAGFTVPGAPLRRLRPADVAVLVRTGREAAAVRHALHRRGVATVYLSDKDSVFQTSEAADLLRLLQAVAAPHDVRLARTALATALLGLTLPELRTLADDDEAFDTQAERLRALHDTWQAQGLLSAVRRALHAWGLPARWLAAEGGEGERRLTNVLHLAELLQAESAHLEGEQALVRWLAQQVVDSAGAVTASDEQVLRLESDADLVQVVTVHKSKGLEYPLVFLPFAADFTAESRRRTRSTWRIETGGRRTLVLDPDDDDIAAADLERLRGDLRLLYVALTRARHALWVGAAALQKGRSPGCMWHRSALGYLVSGPDPRAPEQLVQDMRALARPGTVVHVEEAGTPVRHSRLPKAAAATMLPPAAPYEAAFDRSWAVSSYSALVRDARPSPSGVRAETVARALRDDEPVEADALDATGRRPADQPWHRFPRGAYAGNFLHDQLEWLAGEGFALATSSALRDALQRRCERQGWGHRAADVLEWLQAVCTRPLPALGGTALAELPQARQELEFWFPSDGLRTDTLDALCTQHLLPGQPRPTLPDKTLHGLLMGFADLVFEHDGRYGVLDYKSNALGARDADYTADAMAAAMLEHRYDVQAAVYLLALHRLLRHRLGRGYDPARQLGGAVYLFLRGIHGPAGGCFFVAPPLALIETLDAMLGEVAA